MTTITPYEALRENKFAVVTRSKPRHIYDLYPTKDIACRICNDLNRRYGDFYEVATIDFSNAI